MEPLKTRLTDYKTAQNLKHNCEGLQKVGIAPEISDLRYIKLAEYEEEQERRERTQISCGSDEWYE